MWYQEAVIYQVYPLGLCGAPRENDGVPAHRILRLLDWVEHIKALGADAVLFNPLMESDRHGYDTRDYFQVDCRLGTEDDLRTVTDAFHKAGIRVIFDGVFNHVGRGFWAFRDVQEKRWDSPYKSWFHLWEGGSPYGDSFSYEGWEGHMELVKLDLRNPDVVRHQFDAIRSWVEKFQIDGLRLDVAYMLDRDYLRQLRQFTDSLKPDFLLLGEMIHGDYRQILNGEMCHSVTNYECCKGLWSSLNSMNLFEIGHSLQRQFGREPWCLYRGETLLSFLDNHDVERIASRLTDKAHLIPAYGLLFGMPGTPSVYYGSEWGMEGRKADGDDALRPDVEWPQWTTLTDVIASMARARRKSPALCYGDFETVLLTNRQFIFQRQAEGERVLVAVNADSQPYWAHFDARCGSAVDLLTGEPHDFGGGSELPPYSAAFWKMEK